MPYKTVYFTVFLFFYILTGILLGVGAYVANDRSNGYENFGFRLSRAGRYYIGTASLYILCSCIIQLIAISFYRQILIIFRLTVILLILGIILEFIGFIISIFTGPDDKPGLRKATIIIFGSVTGFLIILQIFGIFATINYQNKLRKDYEQLSN